MRHALDPNSLAFGRGASRPHWMSCPRRRRWRSRVGRTALAAAVYSGPIAVGPNQASAAMLCAGRAVPPHAKKTDVQVVGAVCDAERSVVSCNHRSRGDVPRLLAELLKTGGGIGARRSVWLRETLRGLRTGGLSRCRRIGRQSAAEQSRPATDRPSRSLPKRSSAAVRLTRLSAHQAAGPTAFLTNAWAPTQPLDARSQEVESDLWSAPPYASGPDDDETRIPVPTMRVRAEEPGGGVDVAVEAATACLRRNHS